MATLWITEYSALGEDARGRPLEIGQEPGTVQVVPFVTSSPSAAFAGGTRWIAIYGSAAFHYKISSSPTAATNTSMKVAADTVRLLGVQPGDKLAAILG